MNFLHRTTVVVVVVASLLLSYNKLKQPMNIGRKQQLLVAVQVVHPIIDSHGRTSRIPGLLIGCLFQFFSITIPPPPLY